MSAIIVSGFPGIGKTRATLDFDGKCKIVECDATKYEKSNFPFNYVSDIVNLIESQDILLIDASIPVLKELERQEIDFDLFYPDKSRRNEFLENFVTVHKRSDIIREIDTNWNDWIDYIDNDSNEHCHKHKLNKNEYISNNSSIKQFIESLKNE